MTKDYDEAIMNFENLIIKTENTYAFNSETSIEGMAALLEVIKSMGLDPMETDELRKGIMKLFKVEVINKPNMVNSRFILAPNHVSDFDAPILGLLHRNIRIISKTDWTENVKLQLFLKMHYDLRGLNRNSKESLFTMLKETINYLKENEAGKHFMIFSQGTISDFNNNGLERVSNVAKLIAVETNTPIVCMFIEQPSIYYPTRIVFDEPIKINKGDDFREIWLERLTLLQNSLSPKARKPQLTEKHSNNNKKGEIYFN